MRGEGGGFDVKRELDVGVQARQRFVGPNQVAVLNHVLQHGSIHLKVYHVVILVLLPLSEVLVKQVIHFLECLVTNLPLAVMHSLS